VISLILLAHSICYFNPFKLCCKLHSHIFIIIILFHPKLWIIIDNKKLLSNFNDSNLKNTTISKYTFVLVDVQNKFNYNFVLRKNWCEVSIYQKMKHCNLKIISCFKKHMCEFAMIKYFGYGPIEIIFVLLEEKMCWILILILNMPHETIFQKWWYYYLDCLQMHNYIFVG
jgi:hypothetical protein